MRKTLLLALVAIPTLTACSEARSRLVKWFTPSYEVQGDTAELSPTFTGADEDRPRIDIGLERVVEGFEQPTDLQFVPGTASRLVVLEKPGTARWVDLASQERGTLLTVEARTDSEEGLLGLAFHPDFARNGRFLIHYSATVDGKAAGVVELWKTSPDFSTTAERERRVLTVPQPYPNHNAGQLAFGPDGYLYVGLGDGGWMNDPHEHGQNPTTALGSMLRIDIDRTTDERPYAVPADNPFIGREGYLPETWAYGLRNPWRYSFDSRGRLFVADVGQDKWEEINLVQRGGNYGWNAMEGRHCFPPDSACNKAEYRLPIYEYGREEGQSLTGGYVYEGDEIPALRGKYVFGDFVQGRLWAIEPPEEAPTRGKDPGLAPVYTLGRWPLLPASFGRDARGNLYLADFAEGTVYRLSAPARNAR